MAAVRKLILFGGTFDPPHLGHVQCVEAVRRRFPDQEIWILPAKVTPGIGNGTKEAAAPWGCRYEMCQLTFGSLGSDQIVVSDIESKLPTPNYTIQTIEKIESLRPGAEISLVLGWDQFQHFARWHRPMDIIAKANLIVISRSAGWEPDEAIAKAAAEIGFDFRWAVDKTEAATFGGKSMIFIDANTADVSSTTIRNLLSEGLGDSAGDGWLEPRTRNYITRHKLYRHRQVP
jgi:nicotinate-nucleotide adenylyltransferase